MKTLSVTACLLLAAGIGLGAFGAHGLKNSVPASDLAIWDTAFLYHLVNAVGLFALTSRTFDERSGRSWWAAGWILVASVFVFSGSLYLLVLTDQRWLGAVTPLGGAGFIVAWLLLARSMARS